MKLQLLKGIRTMFGYDAATSTRRRKAKTPTTKDEDKQLSNADRRTMIGTTREQRRNMALCAFMIRKHLDNVSQVTFKPTSGMPEVDEQMSALYTWWSRADRVDVARRHSMHELIRLWEAHRTVDGDVGVLLLRSGALQTIEGDRIAKPSSFGDAPRDILAVDWRHGVDVGSFGQIRRYCIVDRNDTRLEFNRVVSARNMKLLGYFDRYAAEDVQARRDRICD